MRSLLAKFVVAFTGAGRPSPAPAAPEFDDQEPDLPPARAIARAKAAAERARSDYDAYQQAARFERVLNCPVQYKSTAEYLADGAGDWAANAASSTDAEQASFAAACAEADADALAAALGEARRELQAVGIKEARHATDQAVAAAKELDAANLKSTKHGEGGLRLAHFSMAANGAAHAAHRYIKHADAKKRVPEEVNALAIRAEAEARIALAIVRAAPSAGDAGVVS